MKFADSIRKNSMNNDSIIQRLKSQVSGTYSTPVNGKNKSRCSKLMGFEPMLEGALKNIIEQSDNNVNDIYAKKMLDMTLESTACLAASSPNALPVLPSYFKQAVGLETCIWFNAFSGRVYRDAARSQYFHKWFQDQLSKQLNKGNQLQGE
jgi:hypothetical protein